MSVPLWRALLALLVALMLPLHGLAQETAAADPATATDAATPAQESLSDDEIDTLVAPIALYPDALLAQIFVASTYPFEVMKAQQWVKDNEKLEQDQRATLAEQEGWDESVAVLAAGFPSVIDSMAEHIDEVETLGNAVLAQQEDVFASVQRLRAQADAMGNLASNEAQNVTVEGDTITIAPAQPEVVYVPSYDSQAVYETPAPAEQPVVYAPDSSEFVSSGGYVSSTAPATVVVDDDDGWSAGSVAATGLLSFGAGMLVNEIFDDDDDYWGGYWRPGGPPYVGWNNGYIRPRPVIAGNDINIGNRVGNRTNIRGGDRIANIDRDGRWRPDDRRRNDARRKIERKKGVNRPGGRDRPLSDRDRSRQDLKRKVNRQTGGASAVRGNRNVNDMQRKLKANKAGGRPAAGKGVKRSANKNKVAKRKTGAAGKNRKAIRKQGNLKSNKQARARGKKSIANKGKARSRPKAAGNRPKAKNRKNIKRSANRAKPKRKASKNKRAVKRKPNRKARGGGRKAGKARARGKKSRGGGRKRRG